MEIQNDSVLFLDWKYQSEGLGIFETVLCVAWMGGQNNPLLRAHQTLHWDRRRKIQSNSVWETLLTSLGNMVILTQKETAQVLSGILSLAKKRLSDFVLVVFHVSFQLHLVRRTWNGFVFPMIQIPPSNRETLIGFALAEF